MWESRILVIPPAARWYTGGQGRAGRVDMRNGHRRANRRAVRLLTAGLLATSVLTVGLLTACGGSKPSTEGGEGGVVSANAPGAGEDNAAGDIPDNQAFVVYRSDG